MWRARGFTLLALGVIFLGVTVSVYPKEALDLKSIVMNLRQGVKDLDDRLRRLEGIVNDLHKSNDVPPQSGARDPAASHEAYQNGRALEDRREYQAAVDSYTKAIALDPGNDSAFLHRGYSLFELKQLNEALSDVNRSIKIQRDNSRAYAFRAKVYREMKDYQQAMVDLEQALSRDPDNPEFLVSMASIEEEEGHFEQAADVYTKALQKSDSAAVHVKRALALQRLNRFDDALSECSMAMKLDRGDAEAYACRAGIYIHKGLLPDAISDLKNAIQIDPNLPAASNLATTLRQLADLDETATKLSEKQSSEKQLSEKQKAQPVVVSQEANPPEPAPAPAPAPSPAITEVATKTITSIQIPLSSQASPVPGPGQIRETSSLTTKARELAQNGQLAKALDLLNSVLQTDPSNAVAYNSRGYVYLRLRQCEPAIRDFSSAIQIRPGYANAYWNRGVMERLCGNQTAGKEDMEKGSQASGSYYSRLNLPSSSNR
jgi:tetratricopeptide (TPR) repeat protein